jgi:hypothetical protein
VSAARGVVLDAGAFIALERRDRVMVELARRLADPRRRGDLSGLPAPRND